MKRPWATVALAATTLVLLAAATSVPGAQAQNAGKRPGKGAASAVSAAAIATVAPAASTTAALQTPPAPEPPNREAPTTKDPGADGAKYDTDDGMAQHADPVVQYVLSAKLDPAAHSVHGEGSLTWRNASNVPVREIWIHLYLNAFKNQKSTFFREPVGGFRGATVPEEWGAIDVKKFSLRAQGGDASEDLWPKAELRRDGDDDETDVRVPLPRAVGPGEVAIFDMVWDDKLPSVVERTGFHGSFHMVAQWFPKIARLEPDGRWAHFPFHHLAEFYADYGTYDVTMDVPETFLLGATGPVVSTRTAAGRRIERHVQSDVHDFAWSAWDQFQTATAMVEGVEVTLLYPPGCRSIAERQMATIKFALPHFGKRYGRYPYRTLTIVSPPDGASEAGGMEYPTFITTGGPWFGPPGVMLPEVVTVHEFGHQYFYGLLGSDEVSWPFLDEGLNSYAEAESLDAWKGAGSNVDLFGLTIASTTVQAVGGRRAAQEEMIAKPAYAFATGENYGALVYNRTAAILRTFSATYGEERMQKAMGRYARKFRFKHPNPDDFTSVLGEVLGEGAEENLRAALFSKGWVDYKVVSVVSERQKDPAGIFDKDGKRETVKLPPNEGDGAYKGWVLLERQGTLRFPVDVEFVLGDGTRERHPWDGKSDTLRMPYEGAVPLAAVVVDPDRTILLDADFTNNHKSASNVAGGGATRSFERLLYWGQLVIQWVSP
ncbi:MAG: M1 family metallopeptidase [Polyangiaceae bacterium]